MTDREPYALNLSDRAKKDLKNLDRETARRIVTKLEWLALNAAEVRHTGLSGEFSGLYRWRIGDYRILYSLDHEARIIVVARIGHRRDIYAI